MNYHNIVHDDMVNGQGLRVTLFVSGCERYCNGCQNPQTWDKDSGIPFDKEAVNEILYELSKPHVSGLTISGGDPFYKDNRGEILNLLKLVKDKYKDKNIWVYTGFRFEDIWYLPHMEFIDVVCDGEFKQELADVNTHWVGSTNQRVIDVKQTLERKDIVLLED